MELFKNKFDKRSFVEFIEKLFKGNVQKINKLIDDIEVIGRTYDRKEAIDVIAVKVDKKVLDNKFERDFKLRPRLHCYMKKNKINYLLGACYSNESDSWKFIFVQPYGATIKVSFYTVGPEENISILERRFSKLI